MRNNSGTQLMNLSKYILWVGVIISFIAGVIIIFDGFPTDILVVAIGFGVVIAGCAYSLIISWFLDALGSLVDNSFAIVENQESMKTYIKDITEKVSKISVQKEE